MAYIYDVEEYFDEEFQRQLRAYREKTTYVSWYKIQNAVNEARKFKMYHEKLENYTLPNLFRDNGDPILTYYHYDPERRQVNMIKRNLEKARKHKYSRGRVTPYKLRRILKEIGVRRAEQYLEENMEKRKLLCIVGQSGVGKTLASLHLQNYKGANVICSYTTRPPRQTEVEGREHHFIDIVPDRTELLAYTHFGEYYYYAMKSQVFGPCTVYVIDEKGLKNLKRDNGDEFEIYTLYMKRDMSLRRRCGITVQRTRRDEYRERVDEREYDYVVENNGSKVQMFDEIERIYDEICKK